MADLENENLRQRALQVQEEVRWWREEVRCGREELAAVNEETASLQEQLSHLQEELVTVKMEQRKCEALSHEATRELEGLERLLDERHESPEDVAMSPCGVANLERMAKDEEEWALDQAKAAYRQIQQELSVVEVEISTLQARQGNQGPPH